MRPGIALVALVVGCSEPGAAGASDGLDLGWDGGAPPMQTDGGLELEESDAQLAGFGEDAGVDAGAQVAVVDAGVDAGAPCYPPEGLEGSVVQLECDLCPEAGCLPIIWSADIGGGTASGEPGIVSADAVISSELYAHRHTFPVSAAAQVVLIYDGDLFEHLHQGVPLTTAMELHLNRDPWTESGSGLPMPGNAAVPSYMRIAAMVTPSSAVFAWTMHRAPD